MIGAARAAAIVLLLLACGAVAARGTYSFQSSDFFCLYQGSRALVTGHDPYDETYWASVTGGEFPLPTFRGGEGASACPGRYGYPLWTAVALIPFGALPLEPAAVLWAALSIGAAVAGMDWSWRAMRPPREIAPVFAVFVIASPMFWLLLISGQPTGVELALAGLVALALTRARTGLAGIALAALTLKPQLVGVTVPAVALRALARQRRLVAAAIASLVVMTLAAAAFIPPWPFEWLGEASGRRLRVSTFLPTAWGLSADVLGNAVFGVVLIGALLVAIALIVRGRTLSTLDVLVLSLPVSLFATPYAWSYDHLVMAPCWAYVLARHDAGRARLGAMLAVASLAVVLPWLLYAVAFARGVETLTAVVPALTALVVANAVRAAR